MPGLTLKYPVHTLDQQLLFPSGTLLTKETLGAVIDSNRDYSYPSCPLLSYGSVKQDFLSFLSTPPYGTIFSEKKRSDFLRLSETAHFPAPILQSLTYFKQYDFHTYAHVLMVFALSTLLAMDLIPEYEECIQLFATGPTHDIGKLCVPLPILKKRAPLTQKRAGFPRTPYHRKLCAAQLLLQRYPAPRLQGGSGSS